MKIAIIYTGLPITSLDILNNHKQYLYIASKNIDTYVHTYNTDIKNIELIKKELKPESIYIDDLEVVTNMIKEKVKGFKYDSSHVRPINMVSMFYKWYKSLIFINFKEYDIVIRNRLDISFVKPVDIFDNDCLNVPMGGDFCQGLMDLFAYGNAHCMTTYKNLFNSVEDYILKDNVYFHPETLLKHHVQKNNLKLNRFECPIVLRNQILTNSAPTHTY